MLKIRGRIKTETISAAVKIPEIVTPPTYTGPVEFIPTREEQTASTAGFLVNENIIVRPIPSNYGMITWDGATLTVS